MEPRTSSLSEKPRRRHLRRLVDWLRPTGVKKVHSLVDKIYQKKNLEMAWQKAGGDKDFLGTDASEIKSGQMGIRAPVYKQFNGSPGCFLNDKRSCY